MKFEKRRIKELSRDITVGFVGSMSNYFVDEGVPLLRGQNIKPYKIEFENLKFIPPEIHAKWKKSALRPGDVVIVRVGYPGTTAVVPEGLGDLNAASLVIVRPNPELLNSYYLSYVLNSPWGQSVINGHLVGAAQQVFNTNTAADLEIPAPPLVIQHRIASVLSAYDDLIENNTRRIAILEEMARRIYEEWFVRFRFPGHEQVKMVESELGLIPEGWQVGPFTEFFDVRYGKTLPTKHLSSDGEYPVYGGGGVIGRYNEYVVPGPTCLITSRGNGSGTVWRTTERAFVTNNSFVVVPKGEFAGASYGFAQLFSSFSPIKTVLGGAAQPQLTLDGLTSLRVVGCPNELCLESDSLVQPMFDLANKLHEKNDNLRVTRDLLLPKLISGELDVSTLPEPEEATAA